MGRWIGLAVITVPLLLILGGVAFGFEGFLKTTSREGLATPPGGAAPAPAAPAPTPPPPPVKSKTTVSVRILDEGRLDENTVVPADQDVTLDKLEVKPLYRDSIVTEERPVSVVFVIDNSLSMITGPWGDGNDPDYQRLAATKAALSDLGEDDRAAIVTFPKLRRVGRPYSMNEPRPSIFSAFVGARELIPLVDELRYREDGGTPLFAGAEMGMQLLATEPKDRIRVMVLITDGRQEPEIMVPSSVLEARNKLDAQVYGISLGRNTNFKQMASFTDEIVQVNASKDLVSVFKRLIEKSITKLTGYDVKAQISRMGKPFVSGEIIKVRAMLNGKQQILEAKVP